MLGKNREWDHFSGPGRGGFYLPLTPAPRVLLGVQVLWFALTVTTILHFFYLHVAVYGGEHSESCLTG